ncbi:hypothetical protein OESDEN_19008, partial [Oesophagostomum dentatum]
LPLKVQSFWGESLDKASLELLGDRFALDGLSEVIRSTEKSLQTVVNEAIHTVQASSLLAIQSNADMSVKWMYELASDSSHCGYDSVRLSPFRWSKVEDQDNYERKLFSAKGKDLELRRYLCIYGFTRRSELRIFITASSREVKSWSTDRDELSSGNATWGHRGDKAGTD